MESNVRLFGGTSSKALAEKIAAAYGSTLGNVNCIRFSDGEVQVSFEESVRGQSVFLIQSTDPPAEI